MKYYKKIENVFSKVDKLKTEKFYLSQNLIIDDCSCNDCNFYQNEFINSSFDILKKIKDCGVDLRKNINDEPTGVWVIRKKGKLINCQVAYRLYGDFKELKEEFYEIIDNYFKVIIHLNKNQNSFVTIYITFDEID